MSPGSINGGSPVISVQTDLPLPGAEDYILMISAHLDTVFCFTSLPRGDNRATRGIKFRPKTLERRFPFCPLDARRARTTFGGRKGAELSSETPASCFKFNLQVRMFVNCSWQRSLLKLEEVFLLVERKMGGLNYSCY